MLCMLPGLTAAMMEGGQKLMAYILLLLGTIW